MLVLGIETSTPAASVCLGTDKGVVASAAIGPGLPELARAHGAFVAPAIRYCLDTAGVDASAVNGVAVSLGPGLFTGMRVGITTAQAFAHARSLPMVGLASLDLLAFPHRHVRRQLCSVIDARRGELFWATYKSVHGGVQRLGEFRRGRPDVLAAELEATTEDTLCVGEGAVQHRGLLESAGADVAEGSVHPDARALVALAMGRFIREETRRPEELTPIYLRQADAQIGWAKRGALHGGTAGPP
ncbi:tRNA (adenosine(37)-N6)-threonylcarbamoyltransferase complex dimerization subunit type 1 TsaB [Euzebya sp.]|uniref:tRNA (adenosine(37)-N6)-threonylcarbamoyltransferase complex dimerization subunit type 1 TsaB n=1 Tax=Euzebya sp. TaxID=1971409 RepID=UPI0035113D99